MKFIFLTIVSVNFESNIENPSWCFAWTIIPCSFFHFLQDHSSVPNAQVTILDLNDYEMPIFSVDRQNNDGFPQPAHDFKDLIMSSDGIIISFAEHNSTYSAAFKNIFDWISRFKGDIWYTKPMLLLATNDGERGAKTVLKQAHNRIARKNPYEVPSFSLPNFPLNFDENKGILDSKLEFQFQNALSVFIVQL